MILLSSFSKYCALLAPVLLLVLVTGLLYDSGYAFRIRDLTTTAADICQSGKCSGAAKPRREFEQVRSYGGFAKIQPPDNEDEDRKEKEKVKSRSKSAKFDNGDTDEYEDSDDEIIMIEVEDDDEVVIDEQEDKRLKEILKRKKAENEEKKRREKEEKEDKEKKKHEEEEKKKKEEERKVKEEDERLLREEAERKLREEQERKLKEEEEQRQKEEAVRKQKEEEERKRREEDRKRREEEEQKRKEEEERKRKRMEEERKRREEEERKRKEEERKRKEEEERKQKEIEERKRIEEEERKRRELEERKRKEEEERNLKEEELRLRLEEERLQEEEECRLKEEEEEKKKQEEERLHKIKEEKIKKEKEEAERKRREKEEIEAEKNRKQEETKRRAERLKKETEEKKIREEAEKKKKSKPKSSNDDDENRESEDSSVADGKELEKDADKDKLKSKEAVKISKKPKVAPPKSDDPIRKSNNVSKMTSKVEATKSTKSIHTSSQHLANLNDWILNVPTFVSNFTTVEDPACQLHGKIFLRQLRGYKLWALQMLDSSAKIPSGLLRGNVNQLGDFDQCLEAGARVKIEDKTVKVQGKYCLASLDLYASHSAAKLPVNLMQGRALIRGNMRDPGHFVPKFTTINWGVCLPAACSAKDARRSIENALDNYNLTTGIKFIVDIDPENCYVKSKTQSYSKETIGVLYFYVIFMCLAVVSTLRDYLVTLEEKGNYSERIIMAFSMKRTVRALFDKTETSSSDIGCIHGIRTLSTIALYAAHKLIPTSRLPYANRVSLTEIASNPLSTVLRTSLFYTDSFLLLSGVLTAYNMAKELEKRGEIRWFCRLIARYTRLTPCLLAVVFWYAFVMEHIGSGPQWNATVKSNADICKENSWINLLYVQNFFPFEEMCATHTHQLALDMQLFLIAPALVFFLQIKPYLGMVVVFFMIQVSATLRYFATSNNNLSLVIFHGMSLKHLYKTANLTYALPHHRATPYLFGVSLGVLLHYIGKNMRVHKIFVFFGWVVAIASGSWSLFSPWRLARRDYVYNVEEATHYAVVSPILTGISLSWVIFACFTNNGGIINRILSSYWMVILSRLSYAIYLSQFAIFFYNIGSVRYSSEFYLSKILDPYEAICVLSVSVILTLLFDIPMQEVKNVIMECSDTLVSVEIEKNKQITGQEETSNGISKTSKDVSTDDEDPPSWNWNRQSFRGTMRDEPREFEENGIDEYRSSRLKRQDIRRQTIIRSDAYDEWDGRSRRISRSEDEGRTSRNDYRSSNSGIESDLPEYLHPRERYFVGGFTRSPMRDLDAPIYRRSSSRERPLTKEQESDYRRRPLITISKEEDHYSSRSPRSSMTRFIDNQRSLSSESEDPISSRRSSYSRRISGDPRITDDDDWEDDLRIRRRSFQERVSSQERDRIPPPVAEEEDDNDWEDSLRRRSSAEGKMALLKEPARPGNMELFTVTKIQLGSSQEPDEEEYNEEMYLRQMREYREKQTPLKEELENKVNGRRRSFASESLPTSFEEDPEKELGSKGTRITVQDLSRTVEDLSRIPPEEEPSVDSWNRLDVKTGGLFKRESIIKSQASEEDPEYLIPERPKLVEQEQEHPLKKAWQMQKSRSEEEGSGAFVIKDLKATPSLEKQKEEPEEKTEEDQKPSDRDGAQSEFIPEPDVACEVTLVWQPRNNDAEDTRSSVTTKSSSSLSSVRLDWPDEDEQLENHKNRRKSEEESWMWSDRET